MCECFFLFDCNSISIQDMESCSFSQKSVTPQSRSQPIRRTWTTNEEQQLLLGLKEVVTRGWKLDNDFKTGHLGVLEQHMAQFFPHSNIKIGPHISSKICGWEWGLCNLGDELGFLCDLGIWG